jgi:hypothetical protein
LVNYYILRKQFLPSASKRIRFRTNSISRVAAVSLVAAILVIALTTITFAERYYGKLGQTDASLQEISIYNFNVEVVYLASWNGTYFGWQGSHTLIAHSSLSGYGPRNETISLKGNVYAGIRLDLTVQKDDASRSNLTVYVSGPQGSGSVSNSTNLQFGEVFIGIGVID